MDILDDTTLRARLEDLDGWTLGDGRIERSLTFDTFRDAIDFIVRIADLADAADHHPDLHNSYRDVEVALTTHSAGGVTDKDLDLARQINGLL